MKKIIFTFSLVLSSFMFLIPSITSAQVVTDPSLVGNGTTSLLGFNVLNANSWNALQSFKAIGIGTTKQPSVQLANSTFATNTVRNQFSPGLTMLGNAWDTLTGSSDVVGWRLQPSSTVASRGAAIMPELDIDVTYDGFTWANMVALHANSTGVNRYAVINNTLTVGDGSNSGVIGSFNATGNIQTSRSLYSGDNGTVGGILGLEGATSGTWSLETPASFLNYSTVVPNSQGDVNSFWGNDGAGNMSNVILTSGSFSDIGTATTTFTVMIGQTMPSTTYKVNVTPTSTLAADHFFVTNKTTTTFDVEYLSPVTGSLEFDYFIYQ